MFQRQCAVKSTMMTGQLTWSKKSTNFFTLLYYETPSHRMKALTAWKCWARRTHLAPQQCCGLAFLYSPCFPCPCFSAGLCVQRIFGKYDLDYELVRTVQEVVTVYLKQYPSTSVKGLRKIKAPIIEAPVSCLTFVPCISRIYSSYTA
jgi:hypothetical protein